MKLNIAAAANCLTASNLTPSVAAAAKIGQATLRAEVGRLGRVTGNLANSIGVKLERTARGGVAADVGFFGPTAKHAHLVEFGTVIRFRSRKGVSSSWNTRGRWAGVGVYPSNFVTRAANLGAMPAFQPLANARRAALESISNSMDAGLAAVGRKALAAAVS
jgi:hypothetical protein